MMEFNPKEAVKVNILGSFNLVKTSVENTVEKFILISTDKAIRPTSIMGATKRVAEHIGSAFNDYGTTDIVSVRFGNVLGSRGSVLPLFMEQLKSGGPLTVTHPDMQRYFMTIPEAVSLVLQASVIGKGGEVLVLDMGDPVRIVQLAEDLIRIHGLEPYKDIDINYTGVRPGEKLFEEILSAEEGTIASRHKKVFIARNTKTYSMTDVGRLLEEFETASKEPSTEGEAAVRKLLRRHVRHFEDN
jgi:FlaA1/EpsC-like NDP-sugar epimerase